MVTTFVEGQAPVGQQQEIVYIKTEKAPPVVYVTATRPTPPPPPPATPTVVLVHKSRGPSVINLSFFLLVYGGMDLGQSLGLNVASTTFIPTQQFFYSWFIGFIVGALLTSVGVSHLPKIVFYMLSCILELIDAILFVSSQDYKCFLAARYLGGAGIGVLTVAYLMHSSEVGFRTNRGVATGSEQAALTLGIGFEAIYGSFWADTVTDSFNLVHGILGIIFVVISFLCTVCTIIESPIYHLRRGDEVKARQCQQKLSLTNQSCTRSFNEAKRYVQEDESQSLGQQIGGSVIPFLKVLLLRCFVAFSISLPLVVSLQLSSVISMRWYLWPMITSGVLRIIGAFISISLLDKVGRKLVTLVALFCMAVLMISMAGIYGTVSDVYSMRQVSNLGMAFQFFGGLYVCSSSTYITEAFPLKVKPFSIALIVCIEQVIHIIVIVSFRIGGNILFRYFLAVGILLLLGLIVLAVLMPETKQMTLREAGERFRQTYDIKMY
ncbi:galactose-proton symporter-like [Drosophila tropicalis]|uniref:galactose-proton symporter-like n=1 Tax=Drosophila tropicalis TaxID=46794 RepID=UPI0035ABDA5D